MSRFARLPLALLAAFALAQSAEAAQRAFVASFGNDANTVSNCAFSTPCRGFAAAMTVVDAGGEVVALDAAGYGTVTIAKSVTLTANPGFYAGIAASTGNAVTIAAADINVILRGLAINGTGASQGVSLTGANSNLSIENCVISKFTTVEGKGEGRGISIVGSARARILDTAVRANETGIFVADGAVATITRASISGNSVMGLQVLNTAGYITDATVNDTVFDNPNYGVSAFGGHANGAARIFLHRTTLTGSLVAIAAGSSLGPAQVTVGMSLVSGNEAAFSQGGAAAIYSTGNNTFSGNTTSFGVLTNLPPQ